MLLKKTIYEINIANKEAFGAMQFDIALIQRVSKEIEESSKRMQEIVNSPNELTVELQKIQSSLNSLQSLTQNTNIAGTNANTAQYAPHQNQS
jgi:regulator of replication initiation timing